MTSTDSLARSICLQIKLQNKIKLEENGYRLTKVQLPYSTKLSSRQVEMRNRISVNHQRVSQSDKHMTRTAKHFSND